MTVAEIAQRAGLTERTFFRHVADKWEVLFDGHDLLRQASSTIWRPRRATRHRSA